MDRVLENIGKGKQRMLFETVKTADDDGETEKPSGKKAKVAKRTTYWVCRNNHVFRHNFPVHRDRAETGLRCPECDAMAKNKVNRRTYLAYMKDAGRADMKQYRETQVKKLRRKRK